MFLPPLSVEKKIYYKSHINKSNIKDQHKLVTFGRSRCVRTAGGGAGKISRVNGRKDARTDGQQTESFSI